MIRSPYVQFKGKVCNYRKSTTANPVIRDEAELWRVTTAVQESVVIVGCFYTLIITLAFTVIGDRPFNCAHIKF